MTLLEDLEAVADGELGIEIRERCREHAKRLREAFENVLNHEQDARDTNSAREWADAALAAQILTRINGGPVTK
jgi:hypothetical protein